MSGLVFKVPPLSKADIRARAKHLRATLGLAEEPFFPIMKVLEHVLDGQLDLIKLEVWSDADMRGAEGLSFKDENGVDRIALSNTVYEGAWRDEPRHRFTAAHEGGHWILHSTCALARASQTQLRAFESSEWQANTFAAEVLMPPEFIFEGDDAGRIASRFGVSIAAAALRLRAVQREGPLKRKPPHIGGGF